MFKDRILSRDIKHVKQWATTGHHRWWQEFKGYSGGLVTPAFAVAADGTLISEPVQAMAMLESEAARVYAKAAEGPSTWTGKKLQWWKQFSAPKNGIDPSVWKDFNSRIDNSEMLQAMNSITCKTAGRSGITVNLLRKSSNKKLAMLLQYFNACIAESKCCSKALHCIQGLDKTRPIGISEALHMVLENVLTQRLSKILHEHKILNPMQSGFVRDGGAVDTCFIIKDLQENAKRHGQHLHMLSTDIKGAFNAPQWWAIEAACRRLGMPESMVQLLLQSVEGTTTFMLTGLKGKFSPGFKVGAGTIQGRGISPPLWNVFFDMALSDVDSCSEKWGYNYRRTICDSDGNNQDFRLAGEALADDLTLFAQSKKGIRVLFTRFEKAMHYLLVPISEPKTIYMNASGKKSTLRYQRADGTQGVIEAKSTAKVAGVYISTRNNTNIQKEALLKRQRELSDNLKANPVKLHNASATLLTSAKIRPALVYKARVTNLTIKQIEMVDFSVSRTVKKKSGWRDTVATSVWAAVAAQSSLLNEIIADRLKSWIAALLAPEKAQSKATASLRSMWTESAFFANGTRSIRSGPATLAQRRDSLVVSTGHLIDDVLPQSEHIILGVNKDFLTVEGDDVPAGWVFPLTLLHLRDDFKHE